MESHCRSLLVHLFFQGIDMIFSFFRHWPKTSGTTTDTEIIRDVMVEGAAATDINMALVSETEEEVPDDSSLPPMTAFDIVVVGAGGGPDESNLSA